MWILLYYTMLTDYAKYEYNRLKLLNVDLPSLESIVNSKGNSFTEIAKVTLESILSRIVE